MDSHRYWAFISYSHRDSAWADWLHKSLERYRPPKPLVGTVTATSTIPKKLSPIFRDRDELPSATDLGVLLREALSRSAAKIVICSPAAAQSKWVNEEILAYKRLGREHRIFCLIVGGEPNASDMPGREHEECFPKTLRFRLGADGELSEQRTEPIAADARPGKDGKNNAKLKLISGILGVGFDSLRRREQQRRARRLFIFSCSATAGMILTSGLAVFALTQRDEARRQTTRAEAETRTANETKRFLVDLFKISDPNEARGNSVTAREMLDKGAARVETELAKQPAIRATLMDTLGTVYMGLGLYAQARPLLEHAVATRRNLGIADRDSLSDALTHQGALLYNQADYAAAQKAFEEAIRIESARPQDPDTEARLAESLFGLGKLLNKEGRFADAEQRLREALAIQQRSSAHADPDVARTLSYLARTKSDAGDLNSAISLMRQSVDMQRELRGAEPHPDLAEALNDMGVLHWRHGELDDAAAYYRESLAMYRRLLGDKHPFIAAGLENLAMSLQDKGDQSGAESNYRQALEMRRELLGPNHPEVGRSLSNLASLQYDRGETQQALENFRQVVAIYQDAYPPDHPETARALNALGFRLLVSGDLREADRDLTEGLAMRRRLFDEHQPDLASSLSNVALLRDAEQQYSEALELAQQARQIDTNAYSANHWRTAIAECAEGAALTGLGRYAEAEARLTHSTAILNEKTAAPSIFRTLAQRDLNDLRRSMKLARNGSAKS